MRLLDTECFLLWGWFLQGSGEQRAEDAGAGDEELHRQPVARHANLVGRLCQGLRCLSCLPAMVIHGIDLLLVPPQPPGPCHNPGGPSWIPHPSLPAAPFRALTVANAVLVDGLHLTQQMVQSFSLSPSPWGPAVILPPVWGGQTSITPSTSWPGGKRGSRPLLPMARHLPAPHPAVPQAQHSTARHGSTHGCHARLGRLGFGRSPVLCHSSQEHPSSAQHPMATGHPAARRGHGRGKEQGPVCCCRSSLALKNKILSNVFLQVFPRAAAFSRRVLRAGLTSANT